MKSVFRKEEKKESVLLSIENAKSGMILGENLYRHDGLLALPQGLKLTEKERDELKKLRYEYIHVFTEEVEKKQKSELVIKSITRAFRQNSFLKKGIKEYVASYIEKVYAKNRTMRKYMIELHEIDGYSYAHCVNISLVICSLLTGNETIDDEIAEVVLLSFLHDIGRIKMVSLFGKEGRFTDEEFKMLWKHPEISYELLQKIGYSSYECYFAKQTHERFDGKGYPKKEKGENISELAQMILLADTYNALSSDRPYRPAFTTKEVFSMIDEERNKAFASYYVDLFLERFQPYQIGTRVELSNGWQGIVYHLPAGRQLLPMIEIPNPAGRSSFVDLGAQRELEIVRIINA